jgi:acyl carrier protein
MAVEDVIKDFIAKDIMQGRDDTSLDLDYPLIEEKVLDSMDIQRVVAFVESRFGVRVSDDALLPENFASVRAIAKMVADMKSGA